MWLGEAMDLHEALITMQELLPDAWVGIQANIESPLSRSYVGRFTAKANNFKNGLCVSETRTTLDDAVAAAVAAYERRREVAAKRGCRR